MSSPADRQRLALLVHEVRSPVAALAALAEAWDPQLDRGARRTLVSLAIAASRGIERVVADAAVTSVRLENVDLAAVAREAVEVARLRGSGVEARIDAVEAVRADPVRVRQALDNLIANALTHAPSEEPVLVRVAANAREVCLSVEDAGPGIPPAERARVFEPGVRLDPSRSGSGLGLAVVQAIADAHGADLRLESPPGGGSTFTLAFPRA